LVLEETRLEMIGELIREARKEAGLSQEALAKVTHTKKICYFLARAPCK
jgi:transcriptional regulator with XRE-family HTH domain